MDKTDPKIEVKFNDYSEKKILDSSTKAFYVVVFSALFYIFLLPFIPALNSIVFSFMKSNVNDYSDSIKYTTNLSQNLMIVLIISVVATYVLKGQGSAKIVEGIRAISDMITAWKTKSIPGIETPTKSIPGIETPTKSKKDTK